MHSDLCKRLVYSQIQQAIASDALFCDVAELEELGYPRFYVRFRNQHGAIRLIMFDCENYDSQPIQITPVDPVSREELPEERWLRLGTGNFPVHSMMQKPFICFHGTRDFYTHEGHGPTITGDRWEKWREQFKIPDLIRHVKKKFISGEWQ